MRRGEEEMRGTQIMTWNELLKLQIDRLSNVILEVCTNNQVHCLKLVKCLGSLQGSGNTATGKDRVGQGQQDP